MAAQAQRQPAPSYASLDDWWTQFRDMRDRWSAPIDQALAGGVLADRIGYAFAAGYQAALRRLDSSLPRDRLACFSVTEEGGAHPRAIESTLRKAEEGEHEWILSGRKKWATLSSDGGIALVVASTGKDAGERNLLRAARVDLGAPGVFVERMPPPPFVPEIPHCRLRFDSVRIAAGQLLPGDGYAEYVKPFRTLEDTHVTAAVLAYVVALAFRYDWPRSLREELLRSRCPAGTVHHPTPGARGSGALLGERRCRRPRALGTRRRSGSGRRQGPQPATGTGLGTARG
jgi:hypothetical protein